MMPDTLRGCAVTAQFSSAVDSPLAVRIITDAMVTNQIRDLAWSVGHDGVRRMTPEGLYGRG